MTLRVLLYDVLGFAFFSTSVAVNIYFFRKLRRIERERADRVAQALEGAVLVDGVTLPLPEDERWAVKAINYQDAKGVPTLVLGRVYVRDDGTQAVYAGRGTYGMRVTPATRAYATRVWIEHRSRAARKSVAGE